MATTLTTGSSTQEKLLRARHAAAKLAQLSTQEKNGLLLAIADAIEAHERDILAANREDIENSGLEGAMETTRRLNSTREPAAILILKWNWKFPRRST